MKKRLIAMLFCLILLSLLAPVGTFAEGDKMIVNYDRFQELFKWTASALKIAIDPQKPLPRLVFMTEDCLQDFYKELTGDKPHYFLNEVRVDTKVNSLYYPAHKTIYMSDNLGQEKTEGRIVHELVHSIQNIYLGYKENNEWNEFEAQKIERIFCENNGFPLPPL
jgi:hypothetical protein